jgi:hypothetical protein
MLEVMLMGRRLVLIMFTKNNHFFTLTMVSYFVSVSLSPPPLHEGDKNFIAHIPILYRRGQTRPGPPRGIQRGKIIIY